MTRLLRRELLSEHSDRSAATRYSLPCSGSRLEGVETPSPCGEMLLCYVGDNYTPWFVNHSLYKGNFSHYKQLSSNSH